MIFSPGEKIKILKDRAEGADVRIGDVLIITRANSSDIAAKAANNQSWWFAMRNAGILFEKYNGTPNVNYLKTLPTDSQERKNYPVFEGCIRYFPAALAGVANISKIGNDKHNPGEELHHARGKSMDHGNCVVRHLMDSEDLLAAHKRGDTTVTVKEILMEVNQMAWRALALSQEIHEKFGAPLAPGAKK